jgi:hypothetical protein
MGVVIGLVADVAWTLSTTHRRLNECARAVGQGKVAVLQSLAVMQAVMLQRSIHDTSLGPCKSTISST